MTEMTPIPSQAYFLSPISTRSFFSEYWECAPLIINRDDPTFFRKTIDFHELDRLVTSVRIPATNCNLARGEAPLPLSTYTLDGSFVDKQKLLSLHQQGATIILRSIDQWSADLTRLRIIAEQFFGFESQINIYLTPGSEKSTPPHWDTHDLIILQIAGTKRWRLFKGNRTLPLADERFLIDEDYVGSDVKEVVLNQGDTLYLPRGIIHEPIAESYSAHISIGIHSIRYHSLVETALQILSQRQGSLLRCSIPNDHFQGEMYSVRQLLAGFEDPGLLAEAKSILKQNMASRMAVELEGRLLEISSDTSINYDSRYRRRGGVQVDVEETQGILRIRACEQTADIPNHLRDALDFILAQDTFDLKDLPGPHVNEEHLALCIALSTIGVLRTERAVA